MDLGSLTLLLLAGICLLMAIGVPLAFATGSVAMVMSLALFGPQSLVLVASRTY